MIKIMVRKVSGACLTSLEWGCLKSLHGETFFLHCHSMPVAVAVCCSCDVCVIVGQGN